MTGPDMQDRAHPFATGRAAARFHISADHLSPDEAMDPGLLPGRRMRSVIWFCIAFSWLFGVLACAFLLAASVYVFFQLMP
ncbi:hypothetical protein [Paracoccus sp. KR1-242]|uniref:hypothetical protein n=1 Tax=Paracoccus sp. KR1-242 TaxID=3410028 RepID=UPI003C03806B